MAGEQILVVEPGMAVQELCRAVLEREGYQVTVSSNAAAALAYVRNYVFNRFAAGQ